MLKGADEHQTGEMCKFDGVLFSAHESAITDLEM